MIPAWRTGTSVFTTGNSGSTDCSPQWMESQVDDFKGRDHFGMTVKF